MTNGGIIEGNTGDISALSDLSPATSYAGQQYCTDDRDWWSKRFGLMLGNQRGPSIWGGGNGLWQATALLKMSPHCRRKIGHPIAEKEARLRPQQLFFHVPVLDEVNSAREEKHKKHNRPMGYLKPSEGKDLVAWKIFGSGAGLNNQGSLWRN